MGKGNKDETKYEVSGQMKDDCTGLVFDHANLIRKVASWMRGEKLLITFEKMRYKRSDAQNRYIWGVVVVCVRAWMKETTGETWTSDEIYTWLRVSLLGQKPVIKEIMGEEVIVMEGKKFSQMNTKEFAEATDLILNLMSAKGCHIPLPKKGSNNIFTDFVIDE